MSLYSWPVSSLSGIVKERSFAPIMLYLLIPQNGVRDRTKITYNTALGVIFAVKKYAEQLLQASKYNLIPRLHCQYPCFYTVQITGYS